MAVELTGEELFDSYSGLHESEYDGQMVTVTGRVIYVGPDYYGLPSIELGNPNDDKTWVACVVDSTGDVATGNTITITGSSEGFTRGMVVLKHCYDLKIVE